MTRRKNVFCTGVPEKVNRNAMPITMPGMVFVTRAMLSMMSFSFDQAASGRCKGCPVNVGEPVRAVGTATRMESSCTLLTGKNPEHPIHG